MAGWTEARNSGKFDSVASFTGVLALDSLGITTEKIGYTCFRRIEFADD